MSLKERFLDLFARSLSGRRPQDVVKPSDRKPQHGHESRQARRLLGRPSVSPPRRPRAYGDPVTTGRLETASQRKHRRAGEARCRAGNHVWSDEVGLLDGNGPEPAVVCRRSGCGYQKVVSA